MNEEAKKIIVEEIPLELKEQWKSERRKRDKIEKLPQGFSFCPSGRDGFIYYRNDEHIMEIYFEMSGVFKYDFLIDDEAFDKWILPVEEKICTDQQKQIRNKFISWLNKNKYKCDYSKLANHATTN